MPDTLLAHRPKCRVELSNGQTVELEFREFTLADVAWLQREFESLELQHDLMRYTPDASCKLIWHLLSSKSKVIFNGIKFEDFDESQGVVVEREVLGHEKLLLSFKNPFEMVKALECAFQSKSLNDFMPEEFKNKKKAVKRTKRPISFRSLIFLRRNTDTQ